METVKKRKWKHRRKQTAVEAQAEAETVVKRRRKWKYRRQRFGNSAVDRRRKLKPVYMREHYSLQRQRSYSDSEEEIRKNNSDAEGIRTI